MVRGDRSQQGERVLGAVDADPERHYAGVLGEVHAVDHQHREASSNGASGNSITFAVAHGLSTGDVVTHNSPRPDPGRRAGHRRQYGVVVPDDSTVTIQLRATFPNAGQRHRRRDRLRRTAQPETRDFVFHFAGSAVSGVVSGTRYRMVTIDEQSSPCRAPRSATTL
jgi:hypothetical protein